jgi:hypothetical protein
MIGFRGKAVLGLVIYFAGFASAIYFIAPDNANAGQVKSKFAQIGQRFDSEKSKHAAETVKTNVTHFISFAEDKASQVGTLIEAIRAADEK